ncbi:MAG TPA: ATP synthase F0 subunit B [Candidatus Gastranaerophilaceae bacterium]|nr:ATP synthase F0 subunit B [Candidatus Gastranaerophilaceae bacterium]
MEFNATFIVSAISFIVFVLIMNGIFYKPLSKIVSQRQEFLDEQYHQANLAKQKSEALIADKENKVEESKTRAKKIIFDTSESAKRQKADLTGIAQKRASEEVSGAKEELEKSKAEAQKVLEDEVKKLAQTISTKILG